MLNGFLYLSIRLFAAHNFCFVVAVVGLPCYVGRNDVVIILYSPGVRLRHRLPAFLAPFVYYFNMYWSVCACSWDALLKLKQCFHWPTESIQVTVRAVYTQCGEHKKKKIQHDARKNSSIAGWAERERARTNKRGDLLIVIVLHVTRDVDCALMINPEWNYICVHNNNNGNSNNKNQRPTTTESEPSNGIAPKLQIKN